MTSTPQTHPTAIRTLKALMALLLAIAAAIQIWLLPAISADFAADAPDSLICGYHISSSASC